MSYPHGRKEEFSDGADFMTALIFHLERNITSPLFYDIIISFLFLFVKRNFSIKNDFFKSYAPDLAVYCFPFLLTIIIIANTFIFCNR